MSLKILLADDSMTAQNMGKKILVDAGHQVVAVSNGAAAMKKIATDIFDLMILDVFMPGYTGLEVCEKVRALPGHEATLVLLTVGKMEPFNAAEGSKVKADGVIVKPFEATDLLATVQKIAAKATAKAAAKAEQDKTVRMAPIAAESDQSYQEWSVTSTSPAEAEETGKEAPEVEMTAEEGATAALDHIFDEPVVGEAAPAADSVATSKLSPWTSEPAPTVLEAGAPAAAGSDWSSSSDWEQPSAAVEPVLETPPEPTPAPADFLAHAEPEAAEPASGTHLELESMLEHAGPAPHVETAPGIEFTSAPRAGEVEIARPHDFEPAEKEAHPLEHGVDPNLVTDRAQLVAEFATRFTAPEDADPKLGVLPKVTEAPAPAAPEAPVEEAMTEAAPEPIAEPAAEYSPGLAREMEQSLAGVPVETPAAPPAAEAAPATLEQSLEQSIVAAEEPASAAAEAPPASEEQQKAGDLEFAAALNAAISNAPVATPEPMHAAEPTPAPAAAAGSAGTVPARYDQEAVTRAVHRVMERMKSEIIEEILRETNK